MEVDNKTIKVVIVDALEFMRLGIKTALQSDPDICVVGEAENISEALKVIGKVRPDVVLMDVNQADGSGVRATARIAKAHKKTKVLIVSSSCDEGSLVGAVSAGAAGFYLKGSKLGVLQLAIRSVDAGCMWFDSVLSPMIVRQFRRGPSAAAELGLSIEEVSSAGLSGREREVLQLLSAGFTNQEVANRLSISVATVKTHVSHIIKRLGVADRTQAAVKAVRLRLVEN